MADISSIVDENNDEPYDGGDSSEGENRDGNNSGYQYEDLLTPCAKIQKYAQSEIMYNRQMALTILLGIFRDSPADSLTADLPDLMEYVTWLAKDKEVTVRTELMQDIPQLAAVCAEYSLRIPAFGTVTVDYLLPLVVKYLWDKDTQVCMYAHNTLLTLMEQGLVPMHAVEAKVCPTILEYTKDSELMSTGADIVTLMSKMARLLGRETTERLFLQRFSELCSSTHFNVRRSCASSFGEFCAVVGKEAYETVLLPCFVELCADNMWSVRKACADVMLTVSCACSAESRREVLAPTFVRLLRDGSRWVCTSAFQTLGPFISTFAEPSLIGLAYNQHGELVLITPSGTEIRILSPMTDSTSNFKHIFCHAPTGVLYQENWDLWPDFDLKKEQSESKSKEEETEDNNQDTVEEKSNLKEENDFKEEDIIVNHMQEVDTEQNEDNVESNFQEETKECVENDIKENIIRNHMGKEEEKEQIENNFKNENSENEIQKVQENEEITENNIKDEIKDSVELKSKEMQESLANLLLDDKSGDNEENKVGIVEYYGFKDVVTSKPIKGESDEDLNKYNFYQYWHVTPDLELDPQIVKSCGSPNKKDSLEQDFADILARIDIDYEDVANYPTSESLENMFDLGTLAVTNKSRSDGYEVESSQEIVPQQLINHFVSMTDPNLASTIDNDMAYHCAFSLPAVALTLGRKNFYLLERTCILLASDMHYKTRKTIASSLHELALILGQEMAAEHLLPIFDEFMKDLDEVRIGILKHLAHFLKLIGPDKRQQYVPRLEKFLRIDNQQNWRFREELGNQLLMAVPLFTPNDASTHIALLAQELLCDKVFAVRHVAVSLLTELVRHLSGDANVSSGLLLTLAQVFAHSKSWIRRQAFALLCSRLISKNALPAEQFSTIVMPHLLDLSWDPVPNVRLVVSRTLARDIIVHEYFAEENIEQHEPVNKVLRRLQADKDRDVRQFAACAQVSR